MESLPLEERVKSFQEIEPGLTKEEAVEEAKRCIQCPEPQCVRGCPAAVDCKQFIKMLAEGKVDDALGKVMEKNPFPCITGRVCPVELQCEGACILAKKGETIKIRLLERFAADNGKAKEEEIPGNGKKAAIVGSGPAGMDAGLELAKRGFKVKVFEADEKPGGMPLWGIPHYKLPPAFVAGEVEKLRGMGIEFAAGKMVGKDLLLSDLQRDNDAVLLCTGETREKELKLKGKELQGVYYWTDFLRKFNGSSERFEGKKAVVIGGGDTAMDCARVAVRLGLDVTVAYRKIRDVMPCQKKEREEAEKEGAKFQFLLSPVRFDGKEKVERVVFQKQKLEGDKFVALEETEELPADFAVIAIGQKQDNTVLQGTELQGKLIEASSCTTKLEKTFAAGDIANRMKTVADSIYSARKAVEEIEKAMRE